MLLQPHKLPLTKGDHVVLRYEKVMDDICTRDTVEADLRNVRDAAVLVETLGDLTNKKVLDVGAGIGAFSEYCARRGAVVLAIEPEQSRNMVCEINLGPYPLAHARRCAVGDHLTKGFREWQVDGQRTKQAVQTVTMADLFNIFGPEIVRCDCQVIPTVVAIPPTLRKFMVKYDRRVAGWMVQFERLETMFEGWRYSFDPEMDYYCWERTA